MGGKTVRLLPAKSQTNQIDPRPRETVKHLTFHSVPHLYSNSSCRQNEAGISLSEGAKGLVRFVMMSPPIGPDPHAGKFGGYIPFRLREEVIRTNKKALLLLLLFPRP